MRGNGEWDSKTGESRIPARAGWFYYRWHPPVITPLRSLDPFLLHYVLLARIFDNPYNDKQQKEVSSS